MQRIIVLRGAPASGKTTLAKSYRNFQEKVAWLKVDNFKDFFAEDASSALQYVNGSAIATLGYLISQGFSVVIDGIFRDSSAIDQAVTIAQKRNIPVKVFELSVSLETLQERDRTREGVKEGFRKPLGDETIAKIYQTLQQNQYPNAIQLDTEHLSLDDCKKLINESFSTSK